MKSTTKTSTTSDKNLEKSSEEITNVRYRFPKEVIQKIQSHQRLLSAQKDRDVSQEETVIDLILSKKN